jgi:hypothetical protein
MSLLKILSLALLLALAGGLSAASGEAPEFRYVPPQEIVYWTPPPEFGETARGWEPPAGYEKTSQPWAPPAGWGEQPEGWNSQPGFGGEVLHRPLAPEKTN